MVSGRKRPLSRLRVAVLGVSRAGLPLALLLAERGHQVVLVEKDAAALASLKGGHYPFLEPGASQLLQLCLETECLQFSSNMSVIKGSEVILLTVKTPVDKLLIPNMSLVDSAIAELQPHLSGGETILLRATVFPGTCEKIGEKLAMPSLHAGSNGKRQLSVGVSFCPERLASGHVVEELKQVPQIISGSTPRALSHALALFEPLSVDLVELSLLEAEVATLFLNAWRYVSFGTANQFYHIAVSKGLDFDKIRSAIIHRYQRATDFPRSGFTAGPRLYQDMMQLSAYCRHTFSLGNAAMLVNETMPDCLVEQARQKLAESDRTFKGLKCGILGMAYKPGSDDCSDSLAFKLRELLLREGADVSCSDACVAAGSMELTSDKSLLENADAIFIGCPHPQYSNIAFQKHQLIFDCWGLVRKPEMTIFKAKGQQFLRVAVVGGAGHVGLPLSLVLADCGHTVVVVDKDSAKIESIQAGKFPFLEAGGPELLQRCLESKPISFTTSVAEVGTCDVIIVTIGTPVNEHLNPCFSVVQACMEELAPHLRKGQTLLLRSTLFPGTSARVLAGLPPGISVSFCPERIAQGKALEELTDLPQIISGSDAQGLEHAKALFAPLSVDLIELNLQEAEVAKLFLNSWRYVAFGIANQFYHIATSKGLNFDRMRAAMVHRYPRAASFPRSGFTAGPCLFKDTMQLAAYCRHTFSLGHAAMLVNETMPDCLIEQAKRHLGQRSLSGISCGILGMAFKPDNDDWRESLAFKLRKLLSWEGATVLCTDVHMQREGFVSLADLLTGSEILFLGCPHGEYQNISIRSDQKIYDCWGFFTKPKLAISTPWS